MKNCRTFKIVVVFWALAFPAFIWFVLLKSGPEIKPVVNAAPMPASTRPAESFSLPMETLDQSVNIEEVSAYTSSGDALLAEVLKINAAQKDPLTSESDSFNETTQLLSAEDYTGTSDAQSAPASSTASATPSPRQLAAPLSSSGSTSSTTTSTVATGSSSGSSSGRSNSGDSSAPASSSETTAPTRVVAGIPRQSNILEELRTLSPLPKVHYSWFLRPNFLKNRENKYMYELARITHSLCSDAWYTTADHAIQTGSGKTIYDNMVYTCARINKTDPEIPSRIGINYSPWHRKFRLDLDAPIPHKYKHTIFNDPAYQAEIDTFVIKMTTVKGWIEQSNTKYGTDVKVGAILLDAERFLRRDNDPFWNEEMRRALDAIHIEAVKLFPEARIEWYGRGYKRWGSRAGSKWDQTPYFTGKEIMTTVSFSCYRLPDAEHTTRIFHENAKYADSFTPKIQEMTPWVALACGYKQNKWMDNWDFDTAISYQMGAKLNGSVPPYDRIPIVIFFLDPFNPDVPAWGKHFVEYCRGAATVSSQ